MKEFVNIERSTYNRLLNAEAECLVVHKELKEFKEKYSELEHKYYVLLTSEKDAASAASFSERIGKLGGEINAAIVNFH